MARKRDWIELAFATNPVCILKDLSGAVERDISTFRERVEQIPKYPASVMKRNIDFYSNEDSSGFRVASIFPQVPEMNNIAVEAYLDNNTVSLVMPDADGKDKRFTVTAYVSAKGRIMYRIDEDEFKHMWQVSRRILKPLIFPSKGITQKRS